MVAACAQDPPAQLEDASSPPDAQVDAGDDAGVDGGGAVTLGTATASGDCEPGAIAGTRCDRLIVSCPGVADLGVGVRVTEPSGPAAGAVVLGTGGPGTGFFEDSGERPLALTNELVSAGYVVVRRAWEEPGWFAGASGVRASSCRYATLLAWIDEQHRQGAAPLCALGLSGGAIEIAYALSRWDAGDRLAAAILLGGPSMTRLDVVCPSVAADDWLQTDCPALASVHGLECPASLACTLLGAADVVDSAWSPGHPCTSAADADPSVLASDGVVAPDARLDYPTTRTRFVLGAQECSATVLLYHDAITSERALELVPGTSHDVFATDSGLQAARAALDELCAPLP